MNAASEQAKNRYLATLEVVRRELRVLDYSCNKLSSKKIDADWVEKLETDMEAAEEVEAFVSRFGRLQDTIGDKLLPRALTVQLETTSSMLDNLNRAERLGWIDDATQWASMRELRNRLIHEYMTDAQRFAADLSTTLAYVQILRETYQRFLQITKKRFDVEENELQQYL